MGNNWHQLWRNKQLDGNNATLSNLIEMVGWKSQSGGLSVEDWLDFIAFITNKINLQPGTEVLEVGCGPGGFLYPLYEQNYSVSGVDYSEILIDICRSIMPDATFAVDEANALPFDDEQFDAIISNSVFHYFEDHDYTEKVVSEVARCLKKGGHGAIIDLNDAEKQDDFMQQRYGNKEEYIRKNSNLPQLFYEKGWLVETGRKYGLSGYVEDQKINNYQNSAYRFNYFFEK